MSQVIKVLKSREHCCTHYVLADGRSFGFYGYDTPEIESDTINQIQSGEFFLPNTDAELAIAENYPDVEERIL